MIAVIAALLPVFLLMIMGFGLRRHLLTEDAHWIGLEKLVYYVLFPALLIQTTARANLTSVPVGEVGGALLLAVLTMAAFCLALRHAAVARWCRWSCLHIGVSGRDTLADVRGASPWPIISTATPAWRWPPWRWWR